LHRFAKANAQLYRNREGFHKSSKNYQARFLSKDKRFGRYLNFLIEQIFKKLTHNHATKAPNLTEVSYKKAKINPLKPRHP
jgi:hypothetical protein